MNPQTAQIHGQERPFGQEIHAALMKRGMAIVGDGTVSPLDILVINRPVTISNLAFDAVTDDQFDEVMGDMIYDVVEIVQTYLPRLNPGSRIVLVGSRGHLGAWGGVHHMAASAALAGLMRTMALEFAARDIAVNLVAGGFVGSTWDTPESRRNIANTACFLAEPDTGLFGETVIVDGGRSLRMTESRNR